MLTGRFPLPSQDAADIDMVRDLVRSHGVEFRVISRLPNGDTLCEIEGEDQAVLGLISDCGLDREDIADGTVSLN